MKTFKYNDIDFSVEKAGNRWDVFYQKENGKLAIVGTGLFEGVSENDIQEKAKTLVKSIFPVGVRCIGPDVTRPIMVGDLKVVLPDVAHPNFIYWNKESVLDIG